VDIVGKGRHVRTVPVPNWVKETLDAWLTAAGIESGPLFRCVCRAGKPWGQGISEKTVWQCGQKHRDKNEHSAPSASRSSTVLRAALPRFWRRA
jgi:site-specific recombinase XerC